ncbi:hypothetical protein ANO11243_065730 [Dothideomycetidae sp. 11243]|nr:hypothetical protein ANO11243_065730 [fungal sp. No.11243]
MIDMTNKGEEAEASAQGESIITTGISPIGGASMETVSATSSEHTPCSGDDFSDSEADDLFVREQYTGPVHDRVSTDEPLWSPSSSCAPSRAEQLAQLKGLIPGLHVQVKEEPCGEDVTTGVQDLPLAPEVEMVDPATEKGPRKRTYRITKEMSRKRNAPLSINTVGTSNLFDDVRQVENAPILPSFDQGKNRTTAIKALRDQRADGPAQEQRDYNADVKMIDTALKELGKPYIKPGQTGTWDLPGLKSSLKPHQLLALHFMTIRERGDTPPYGGILADQMGLGKTVTALSLIIHGKTRARSDPTRVSGDRLLQAHTTLVVCPASLVSQWYEEIGKHCDTEKKPSRRKNEEGIPRYMRYKASEVEIQNDELQNLTKYDLIITSYEEVAKSFPSEEPPHELSDPMEREVWWEHHYRDKRGPLHAIRWKRVILDEAHLIRNPEARRSIACRSLSADYPWCLTGTPFVNGIADLWSLLDFIRYPIEETYEAFHEKYIRDRDDESDSEFNKLLNVCMTRKTHKDKLLSARIVTLPKTSLRRHEVHFLPIEREIYNIVTERFIEKINQMSRDGELGQKTNHHIYTLVLRLRQLTAHPLLLQGTLLELLEREDLDRLNEVYQRYSLQNPEHGRMLIRQIRATLEHHADCQDGSARHKLHRDALGEMMDDNRSGRTADTGRRYGISYKFEKYLKTLRDRIDQKDAEAAMECVYCRKQAEEPWITSCLHIYCQTCLKEAQEEAAHSNMGGAVCEECNAVFAHVEPADDEVRNFASQQKNGKSGRKKARLPPGIEDWLEASGEMIPSSKTMVVKTQILEWQEKVPDDKIIIFTQWLGMVKILANMCKIEKWGCLTFNDSVEQQAFARVYRISQEKETAVVQLAVENSIDERLEAIKEAKTNEIESFGESFGADKLSSRELMGLVGKVSRDRRGRFKLSAYAGEAGGNGDVCESESSDSE